ncbi:MAG TPA: hypothetical protein VN947_04700 [Polyangia bacterium]|nr:hypothetical protein [Polyangia bacterium]
MSASNASAQVTTWVTAPVALGSDGAGETSARVGELLGRALAARPELTLVQLGRQGSVPDLSAARAALAAGREAYQRFQFAASQAELGRAVELVTRAGVPSGESQTLVEALTELATVEEMAGRHADAVQSCEALMVVRPDVTLDPVRVPPRVIQTCEAARARRAHEVRRVTVTSSPPFAQLFVDGQPFGGAPAAATLTVGMHYLFFVGREQQTYTQAVEVAPGAAPQLVRVELPESATARPAEALRARVRRRGPLPETIDAAVTLARVASVERVIVSAVEREGADRWRLWAAAIDPARRAAAAVVVARVGDDFADAPPILARVAEALAAAKAPATERGAPLRVTDVSLPAGLDFAAALFGRAPEVVAGPSRPARERRPKHLWWWIGGAAVVAAAAVTVGLTVGLDNGKLRVGW